jgi:hypothetical protein
MVRGGLSGSASKHLGEVQNSRPYTVIKMSLAVLSCRLAELDQVVSLLSKWLGTQDETWEAVQQAALEKQPALMCK